MAIADLNLEEHYAERADKLADTFRALTATLATSGIGLLVSKYLSLPPEDDLHSPIRLAIASLSISILALGLSLQLQKKKALIRRDMVRETRIELGDSDEKQLTDTLIRRNMHLSRALFTPWFRNELYDALGFYGIAAAAFFVVVPIEPEVATPLAIGGFLVLAWILRLLRNSLRRIQKEAIQSNRLERR